MQRSEDELLRDLYGSNFETQQQYYNQRADYFKLIATFFLPTLITLWFLYTGLYKLDLVALTPIDLAWNWFVILTPSKLLNFFDPNLITNPSAPDTHASKSEKMRRILGLDNPGGIITTVAQASRRRLSSISGISLSKGNESRPAGLGNWDNSCYQNSVLQGLTSLDGFADYLVDPREPDAEQGAPDMKMADALRGLIKELKDASNNGKRIWTPAALKSMSSWQQQDAQEYFSKILDEIDKEVDKAAKEIKGVRGLEAEAASAKDLVSSAQPLSISTLRNPLEGLLAQRVGCTRCGYSEGLSMIPFNCLTVPLGRSWSYNLSSCLDEYTKLEPIEGVECGKCTLLKSQRLLNMVLERTTDGPQDAKIRAATTARLQVVNEALEDDDYEDKTLTQKCGIPSKNRVSTTKSRQAVIARPPKSLAIHVNRSLFDEMTGDLRKNTAEVHFPRTLNLAPWCLGSSGADKESHYEEWLLDPIQSMIPSSSGEARVHGPVYELRAVVTHYGNHHNGHYVCYRKHDIVSSTEEAVEEEGVESNSKDTPVSQWWRISDEDAIQVSEEAVQNQGGVFMLFYDCISAASAIPPPQLEALVPNTETSDLELAANIPLPMDDFDSGPEEIDASHESLEQSTATSVSDSDGRDEDAFYEPAKPIIIPPFVHHGAGGKRQNSLSSGRTVMV